MAFWTQFFSFPRTRRRSVEDGFSKEAPPSINRPNETPDDEQAVPESDHLKTFRMMVGISSTRSMRPRTSFPFFSRPAPNLGIYTRVVYREGIAKRGYKFSSALINGCLGFQIVVAAALTAMGAANSNHHAVTAFGAINTIMAGLLTYLKGSGLPNRLKYYENEWRRIREYIEQRERDLSRPGCTEDVHRLVAIIETMYEEVRSDIEMNTPDSYVSVGNIRNRSTLASQTPRFTGILSREIDAYGEKLKDLESKYAVTLGSFATEVGNKITEKEKDLESRLEQDLEAHGKRVSEIGSDLKSQYTDISEATRDIEDYAKRRFSLFADESRNLPRVTISIGSPQGTTDVDTKLSLSH